MPQLKHYSINFLHSSDQAKSVIPLQLELICIGAEGNEGGKTKQWLVYFTSLVTCARLHSWEWEVQSCLPAFKVPAEVPGKRCGVLVSWWEDESQDVQYLKRMCVCARECTHKLASKTGHPSPPTSPNGRAHWLSPEAFAHVLLFCKHWCALQHEEETEERANRSRHLVPLMPFGARQGVACQGTAHRMPCTKCGSKSTRPVGWGSQGPSHKCERQHRVWYNSPFGMLL